jgi:hypothetical protein
LAAVNRLDGIDQRLGADFFEKVSRGSRQNRGGDSLFVRMRREKQHARAWIGGQNVATRVEPVPSGRRKSITPDRAVLRRPFYRIRDGSRFGDHFDFFRLLEQRPQPESDDLMVIDQHQPDFWFGRHRG